MSLRSGGRQHLLSGLSDGSVRPRPLSEWTLLGVFGVLLTAVVVGVVGGVVGVGLAVAFVVAWLFLPTVYSFVAGHVLALGTTASALSAVELLFIEVGLLAVLFGPLTRSETRARGTVARSTLGFAFVLATVVVVALALHDEVWVSAVVLLLVAGFLTYGLHRYELLTLGLLTDEETDGTETSNEMTDDSETGTEDDTDNASAGLGPKQRPSEQETASRGGSS